MKKREKYLKWLELVRAYGCHIRKKEVSHYENVIAVKINCNRKWFAERLMRHQWERLSNRQEEILFCFPFMFFLIFPKGFPWPGFSKSPWERWDGNYMGNSFPLASGTVFPHSHSGAESSETFWWIPFESSRPGCCLFKVFTQIWERILYRDNRLY